MSRRLEKINRTVRDTVSGVIQTQLSDPRITGLVSVTRTEVSADLTVARVYLSVMGVDLKAQELTVKAISHASGFIQARLAEALTTRNCPTLTFFLDDSLKKGFEVLQLINQVTSESTMADENAPQERSEENPEDDLANENDSENPNER